eukprot:1006840-Amphidinium_carterae.1
MTFILRNCSDDLYATSPVANGYFARSACTSLGYPYLRERTLVQTTEDIGSTNLGDQRLQHWCMDPSQADIRDRQQDIPSVRYEYGAYYLSSSRVRWILQGRLNETAQSDKDKTMSSG